jgi:hypothetical protein
VEFSSTLRRTETIDITLPEDLEVDELPPAIKLGTGMAAYKSTTEIDGRVLRYRRVLQFDDVFVAPEQLSALKQFYQQVTAAEKATAVLKKR